MTEPAPAGRGMDLPDATPSNYPGQELAAMSHAANYHRWIIDEFAPYLGQSVAEIGAGIGTVSGLLLEKNIRRLVAFEPCGTNFLLLEEKLRHEARATAVHGLASARQGSEHFDSVVLLNVLEHIEHDAQAVSETRHLLGPHGHVLLFVPALDFLFSNTDRDIGHLRRYSRDGICRLVTEAGFSIVKARYFDIAGIIPWYINFVLLRGSFNRDRIALYDMYVVPPMRLLETMMPPVIGKNLLVIGRKS